jgi:hypothetical protein
VELRSPRGEVYYKHIDSLTPDDRLDRTAAEGWRVKWHTQRRTQRRRMRHGYE